MADRETQMDHDAVVAKYGIDGARLYWALRSWLGIFFTCLREVDDWAIWYEQKHLFWDSWVMTEVCRPENDNYHPMS